jgi:hypothetical protein
MKQSTLVNATFLALALAVVGSVTFARAAADRSHHDRSLVLSKLNTNGPAGSLSMSEIETAAVAKFTQLDTDHDGTLDAHELTGIATPASIAKFDTNKDGTLDKAEYLKLVKKTFRSADNDHDGTLTARELSTEPGIDLVALLAY